MRDPAGGLGSTTSFYALRRSALLALMDGDSSELLGREAGRQTDGLDLCASTVELIVGASGENSSREFVPFHRETIGEQVV